MIKGKDYTKYGMNEDWSTKHSYKQSPVFVIARDKCNLELVGNLIISEDGNTIDTTRKLSMNCSQCKQSRNCAEMELYFTLLGNKDEQVGEFQVDSGL